MSRAGPIAVANCLDKTDSNSLEKMTLHKIITGILTMLVAASVVWIAILTYKVARLEKQLEPALARQAMENRQQALREKFAKRTAQDRQKYTQDQLREAEQLYQVANQKWGTPEAAQSLKTLVQKYSDLNRAGCAVLYLVNYSKGDEQRQYLQDAIAKYDDCFYGDGVQVGAYARFLLAQDYQSNGETEKARALFDELKSKYPDAIDHSGKLLAESIR